MLVIALLICVALLIVMAITAYLSDDQYFRATVTIALGIFISMAMFSIGNALNRGEPKSLKPDMQYRVITCARELTSRRDMHGCLLRPEDNENNVYYRFHSQMERENPKREGSFSPGTILEVYTYKDEVYVREAPPKPAGKGFGMKD